MFKKRSVYLLSLISRKNSPLCKLSVTGIPRRNELFTSPNLRQYSVTHISSQNSKQEVLLTETEENNFSKDVINKVNSQISSKSHGRLFATVHISGSQHLITTNDLLAIKDYFPPNIGDRISVDKVLCVGGSDFTLYGRPLLPKEFVKIEATVVEKSLAATQVHRNPRGTMNFLRSPYTVLRINSISLEYPIDQLPSVTGVKGKLF